MPNTEATRAPWTEPLVAQAVAHANIALAKYWGKALDGENMPAVPSLSLTLDRLHTETQVRFDPDLVLDSAVIDGLPATGRPLERIVALLDTVRSLAGFSHRARVESRNNFPTASGLASSASGFAALALAATRAAGVDCTPSWVSALARRASASAARSIFGGYVVLRLGEPSAEPALGPSDWPLKMVVALTTASPKPISSTEAMLHTAQTSPYYDAWVRHAPLLFDEMVEALLARQLDRLGTAMEESTLMMHACMLAARPAVFYLSGATLAAMETVKALRADGFPSYFTMDAGPHVKVLTTSEGAVEVEARLEKLDGVQRVVVCAPGPGAHLVATNRS